MGLAEGEIDDWRDDAFSEIDLHILPTMHGPNDPRYRDYVAMVCTRDWKYVHFPNLGFGELYDMVNDPHELHNLFDDPAYATKLAEMRLRLLNRFMNNQRGFIGERTDGFMPHFLADHRPPEGMFPGVVYAPPEEV